MMSLGEKPIIIKKIIKENKKKINMRSKKIPQ